jgi:HEAT repeat protein
MQGFAWRRRAKSAGSAPFALPVLLDALKDKDAAVRQSAATALGQFPSEAPEIIPLLRDTEKDKNKMVERAAKMSLKSLREQKKP